MLRYCFVECGLFLLNVQFVCVECCCECLVECGLSVLRMLPVLLNVFVSCFE